MFLACEKPVFGYRFLRFAPQSAMIGNRALLIGDDNFDTGLEYRFLQVFFVGIAVFRVRPDDVYFGVAGESLHHFLDILRECRIAEDIGVTRRCRLVSCHRCGLVIQDDIGDVLSVFDGIGDGCHAAVEKGGIAHEDYLFVFDERVNAGTSGTAECHRGEVVHQARKRFVFEHRIAADVTVKHQIYRGRVMLFFHVTGIHELLRDLEEDAGRIAMRAAGTERRGALRDVKLLFGYPLL